MGYYTDFDISNNDEEIQQRIEELSTYTFYDGKMNGKWYEDEKDCKQVSLEFPNTLIKVEGVGEETGDLWKAYYFNGKMQRVNGKITFEDFDEGKLK